MKLWQKNLTGKQSKISDSSWILTDKKDHQVQIPSQTLPNADTQYFTPFSRLTPMLWLTANIPGGAGRQGELSHRERKRTQEHNSKDIVESIPRSHKLKKWQYVRESDITQGRYITKSLFWHHTSVLVKPFLYCQYSRWIFSKFDSLHTAENIYKPHLFNFW